MSTDSHKITFTVNGDEHTLDVAARRHLADVLREELGLTGTHLGCEHGVCGACTVSVEGEATRACLVLAVQVDGSEITTIEGLTEARGTMGLIQRAMWEKHAFQCAFCAPGFMMSMSAMLCGEPDAHPRGDQGGPVRKPLPPHRLPLDPGRRHRGGRHAAGDESEHPGGR